jgi:transcription antitermination protein NusB
MKSRTKARSIALQVLYEADQSNHLPGLIVTQRLEDTPLDDRLEVFVQEIISGIVPIQPALDEVISHHAPEWPFDQVAIIDRNILRIALWEMTFTSDTPIKVIINEAIELGKQYGSDSSPRFINGVLGSLVNDLNTIKQHLVNYQRKAATE